MNIANGCCGSSEYSADHAGRVREREALAAAESIGAEFHPSLVNDLEIFYDHETLTRLAAVMREVAPEILLVHCADRLHGRPHERLPAGGHGGLCPRHAQLSDASAAAAGRAASDDLSRPAARQSRSAGPAGATRACSSTSAA